MEISDMDKLNEEELQILLNKNIIPVVYDSIDSTNLELKRRIKQGVSADADLFGDGQLLIISNEQTIGRGRLGRTFESPKGTGIYMSLLIRPLDGAKEALLVTSAAAVAVSLGIEKATGIVTGIKWVNDIYLYGRKICGILAESVTDAKGRFNIILGIGINVMFPGEGFDESLKDIAGALYYGSERKMVSRNVIAASVINTFVDIYHNIESRNYMEEYKRRSVVLGKRVSFLIDNEWKEGKAVDIDSEGALIIDTEEGIQVLNTGEITLRIKKT